MNPQCKKIWSRQFMSTAFTHEFMSKKYVRHREDVLLEHEKSLLPATQPLVERIIYRETELKKTQEKLNKIDEEIINLTNI